MKIVERKKQNLLSFCEKLEKSCENGTPFSVSDAASECKITYDYAKVIVDTYTTPGKHLTRKLHSGWNKEVVVNSLSVMKIKDLPKTNSKTIMLKHMGKNDIISNSVRFDRVNKESKKEASIVSNNNIQMEVKESVKSVPITHTEARKAAKAVSNVNTITLPVDVKVTISRQYKGGEDATSFFADPTLSYEAILKTVSSLKQR